MERCGQQWRTWKGKPMVFKQGSEQSAPVLRVRILPDQFEIQDSSSYQSWGDQLICHMDDKVTHKSWELFLQKLCCILF